MPKIILSPFCELGGDRNLLLKRKENLNPGSELLMQNGVTCSRTPRLRSSVLATDV